MCFVDLENDHVPQHLVWEVLQEYLVAYLEQHFVKSGLFLSSVRVMLSFFVKKPFKVCVRVLSLLLFVVFIDRISRHS